VGGAELSSSQAELSIRTGRFLALSWKNFRLLIIEQLKQKISKPGEQERKI